MCASAMRYIFYDWIFPMHNPINENINDIGVWKVHNLHYNER